MARKHNRLSVKTVQAKRKPGYHADGGGLYLQGRWNRFGQKSPRQQWAKHCDQIKRVAKVIPMRRKAKAGAA